MEKYKNIITSILLTIIIFCNGFVLLFSTYLNSHYFNVYVKEASSCEVDIGNLSMIKLPSIKDIILDLFGVKEQTETDQRKIMVYPGGYPLGFTMECQGVIVVSIGDVLTTIGNEKPMKGKNIKIGDVIHSIDGEKINNAIHMQSLLNRDGGALEVEIEIHRGEEILKEKVEKKKELSTGLYRLGVWVRDNTAGVGTLTYIRADNNRFGALGHSVCDIDTGKVLPVSGGKVYKCNVVGFNKGLRGIPGELRGLFLKNGITAGDIDNSNDFGVYGVMGKEYVSNINQKTPVQVGFRDSVKTGKATILSTIDGGEPKEYDVEIIKLSYQSKSDKKSMVLRITDEELISQTGGIVQGMSGSPIMQDGKLIGAVTHVFVNDPTKGFGVYIDWMIDN